MLIYICARLYMNFCRLYFKPPEMDLNELYVFHLKTELEKEKMKRRLDALVSQIAERKERILVSCKFIL